MPGLSSIANVWNNVKEVDLRPIRQEALQSVRIVIVGAPGSGRKTLARQMSIDPARPELRGNAPVLILDLDQNQAANDADLILLVMDSRRPDFARETELARSWAEAKKKVVVLINQFTPPAESTALGPWVNWGQRRVIYGPVTDTHFLLKELSPVMIELLPEKLLALGRNFPLFRVPLANHQINETCFSNAAYSLSTGVAEVVPVLDIPLNVADMFVLTKAQAFLVYKLGLALGFSTDWQDYVNEFGGVLGSGFIFRQLARSLIGLIPAYGIIPKVAVAYSGTYVVGHVVLEWYLTGRHVTKSQMQKLYTQAFARGKNVARSLAERLRRKRLEKPKEKKPRLGKRAKTPQIPSEAQSLAEAATRTCPNCGRKSAQDAAFCQYCGYPLQAQPSE